MTKEELEKEAEEYLHNNYCCKNSYCEFNTECKERVRIRCTEFEILEKHIVNFAEPREKRIEELIALINAERERQEKCDDIHLRTIADLEKENAKLKNKLEHRNCLDCSNHSSKLRMKTLELEKECTKAKEIIRDLINLTEPTSTEEVQHWNETFRKAEKFLSEVENV